MVNESTKVALDFAGVLDIFGFTDDEFVSVIHWGSDGTPQTWVGLPSAAPGYAAGVPETANAFYGVNPVTGPARRNAGRGKEADITRLAALPVDLDHKPGGCASRDVALAIIAELGIILGTRSSVIVDSGHGVHAYWPIEDGQVTDGDITRHRALLKRWGRLVALVAGTHNVHADNVFDLPRVMRLIGSHNNKCVNGEAPPLVTGRPGAGRSARRWPRSPSGSPRSAFLNATTTARPPLPSSCHRRPTGHSPTTPAATSRR